MSQVLLNLIASYSLMYGVDPVLATAVISHESKFNASAVGNVGEIGLMQLRPEYFSSTCRGVEKKNPKDVVCGKELFNPKTNIEVGIRHLAEIQKSCKHKGKNLFVVCHNLGVAGGNKIKNASEQTYYKKVMKEYSRLSQMNLFKTKPKYFDVASLTEF